MKLSDEHEIVHFYCRYGPEPEMPIEELKRFSIKAFRECYFVFDERKCLYAPSTGYLDAQKVAQVLNESLDEPYLKGWRAHPDLFHSR